MASLPVPPEAVPHVPKSNALEWRGFAERKMCSHVSGLHGNFFPLATDGERAICKTVLDVIVMTQLSAIIWPETQRLARPKLATQPKSAKASRVLKKLGLSEEDIKELLNI